MRLASLSLDCYGPFDCRALRFETAPGRLNLLLAPNGWGKSVLRRAIGDLLFDVPQNSPMDFLHVAQKMRLRACIEGPDGTHHAVVRRKGRGNTLADQHHAPVPPEAFRRLTGAADRVLFEELFALDTNLLRKGGDALLASGGRLGQVLFAGGGGLARVSALLDQLTARRDEIGRVKRRDTGRPLWKALSEVEQAARDLREASLRPEQWTALEKRVADADSVRDAARAERAQVEARLAGLRLLRSVRPWVRRRSDATERLAAAGDAPRLEEGFEGRWRAALEARAHTASAALATARQWADAGEAAAAICVDAIIIGAGDAIDALAVRRGNAVRTEADLPEIAARLGAEEADVLRLRHELGWERDVELPSAPCVRAAQSLLKARAGLVAAEAQAEREYDAASRRLAAAKREVAGLAASQDFGPVSALLADLRANGDPIRTLARLQDAVHDAECARSAALADIPDRRMSVADLEATHAPSEPALAAAEAALTQAAGQQTAALRERDNIDASIRQHQDALAALVMNAALPDPHALADARAARDRHWQALQRALAGDEPVRDPSLPVAFDRALRHADAVADALLEQSAQVAEAASLRARLAGLAAERAGAEAACTAATQQFAEARASMDAVAQASGAPAAISPPALRAFLRARQTAVERRITLDRCRSEAEIARSRIDAAAARLSALLCDPAAELPDLLETADRRITAAAVLEGARVAAARELRGRQEEAEIRGHDLARSRRDLAEWATRWRTAADRLWRPTDEAVDATDAVLGQIEALRVAETARAKDAPRVADMQGSLAAFAADVRMMVARVAPDLAHRQPSEAAGQLVHRLQAARESAAKERALRQRSEDAGVAASAARERAAAADRQLAALRAALRADTDDAAEAQLRHARAATDAARDLADAEQHLLAFGAGQTIETLEGLATASTAEADEAAIAELTSRSAELSERAEAAAADARSAAEERDRYRHANGAAHAAARREAGLAALARHADEALVLHAAISLLQAGLERQRGAAEDGLVRRIGAVFRNLTCGMHAGVAVEEDSKGQHLVALAADGVSRQQIGELSEGTRDQLYLALRAIALEEYAAAEPALPFIADDILQTFDDARTLASLHVLLDLSRHVQVIALTHHAHVISLAANLPAGAVHTLILPGSDGMAVQPVMGYGVEAAADPVPAQVQQGNLHEAV